MSAPCEFVCSALDLPLKRQEGWPDDAGLGWETPLGDALNTTTSLEGVDCVTRKPVSTMRDAI